MKRITLVVDYDYGGSLNDGAYGDPTCGVSFRWLWVLYLTIFKVLGSLDR